MNKTVKRIGITLTSGILAVLALYAAWWNYDPTIPWDEAENRLQSVIQQEFQGQARIVERRTETQFPDLIPFLIRHHPRYIRQPKFRTGFPDNSVSIVISISGKEMRCYSHLFRGRVAGFSILYLNGALSDATRLANGIRKAFPNLPVTVQESETLKLKEKD